MKIKNRRRFFARKTNTEQSFSKRIVFINFFFIGIFLVLIGRLFSLQVKDYSQYAAQAAAIHDTEKVLPPERGLIYCKDKNDNLIPLAINKKYYDIFVVPKEIKDSQAASLILSKFLPLPQEEIFQKLNKPDDPYEILFKKIEDEELIKQIKEEKLEGVYFEEKSYRYYPLESFASQVIGFLAENEDGKVKGRYGLESYYDDILSGQDGTFVGIKDALGRLVRSILYQEKMKVDGVSLVTTIDKNIQFAAEKALSTLITERKATDGTMIVMEPTTGKILALANWPTFNLNEFNEVKDYSLFRNLAVEGRYEPGSVMKPITMAAGLDSGKVTPETTYVDKGYYEVGGYTIRNYKNRVYGEVNMTKVLEQSINTGAIFVSQQVGNEGLRRYFKKFGLAEVTGIDLPSEIAGDLSNLEYPKANPTYFTTASYGEGIAITPMELIKAYATIINKGKSVTPYVVESLIDSSGVSTQLRSDIPEESQQVISEETSSKLISMLASVIENGFGNNAKIKGYSMGGKTGTSYVYQKGGVGYTEDVFHTFVAFFPVTNPRFLILVKMDKPLEGEAAGYTVTFAFKEVEQFLINYYNIPPDEIEGKTQ